MRTIGAVPAGSTWRAKLRVIWVAPPCTSRAVVARLEEAGIRVTEVVEQDLSLEDVFLAVVEGSRGATHSPARP